MQAFIRALEARGGKIVVENEGQRRSTTALVDGQPIQFRLSESVQKVKRPSSTKSEPHSIWERSSDYLPRGRLKFIFGHYYSPKTRADWEDTSKAPLEEKLHLVIAGVIEQAELGRPTSYGRRNSARPGRSVSGRRSWSVAGRKRQNAVNF